MPTCQAFPSTTPEGPTRGLQHTPIAVNGLPLSVHSLMTHESSSSCGKYAGGHMVRPPHEFFMRCCIDLIPEGQMRDVLAATSVASLSVYSVAIFSSFPSSLGMSTLNASRPTRCTLSAGGSTGQQMSSRTIPRKPNDNMHHGSSSSLVGLQESACLQSRTPRRHLYCESSTRSFRRSLRASKSFWKVFVCSRMKCSHVWESQYVRQHCPRRRVAVC